MRPTQASRMPQTSKPWLRSRLCHKLLSRLYRPKHQSDQEFPGKIKTSSNHSICCRCFFYNAVSVTSPALKMTSPTAAAILLLLSNRACLPRTGHKCSVTCPQYRFAKKTSNKGTPNSTMRMNDTQGIKCNNLLSFFFKGKTNAFWKSSQVWWVVGWTPARRRPVRSLGPPFVGAETSCAIARPVASVKAELALRGFLGAFLEPSFPARFLLSFQIPLPIRECPFPTRFGER